MTTAIRLKPFEGPDATGRQRYDPLTVTVKGVSQYNANEFGFEEIDGFWNWPVNEGFPKPGQKYRVYLTTKPKTGPRAKPGSMYRDVVKATPVIVEGENEYIDLGDGSTPLPDSMAMDTRADAPAARSPLAGQPLPAEWKETTDYWYAKQQAERASIETQVAFKGLIELYGHMLAHAELVDPSHIDDTLALTKELVARLGRVEWPTPEEATEESTKVP